MLTVLIAILLMPTSSAAAEIEVTGLFSDAAMLTINGKPFFLRNGQSQDGVTLIDADSREAVIDNEGETVTVSLSQKIGTSFKPAEKVQVHIAMSDNHQYIVHGSINGKPVRYLVDTGANVVAMNSKTASALGISLEKAKKVRSVTASDETESMLVTVAEMRVGEIRRNNVAAVVIPGEFPRDVLLGMTFLNHVEITENAGLMVLTSEM